MSVVATATAAAVHAATTSASKPRIVPFSGSKFPPREVQTLYLSMQMLGLVCVVGLGLTIWLASSVKRHPFIYTYLALTASLSIATTISLIPAGGYMTKIPSYPYKLVQSAFGFSGGAATAYSDLMLATLMCLKIARPGSKLHQFSEKRSFDIFIIGSTWAIYVVSSIGCLVTVSRDISIVQHLGLLCVFALPSSLQLYQWSVVIFNGLTVVVDLMMIVLLIKQRAQRPKSTKTAGPDTMTAQSHSFNVFPTSPPPTHLFFPPPPHLHSRGMSESKVYIKQRSISDWGLAIRVAALGCFFQVNMILNILLIVKTTYAAPAVMYSANRGTIIAFIFASQTDILNVYIGGLNRFLVSSRDAFYHALACGRGNALTRSSTLSSDERRFRTASDTTKALSASASSHPRHREKTSTGSSNDSFATDSSSSTDLCSTATGQHAINVLTFSQKPASFGDEKDEERSFSEYSAKKPTSQEKQAGETVIAGGRGVIMVTVETEEFVEEVDVEAQRKDLADQEGFSYYGP